MKHVILIASILAACISARATGSVCTVFPTDCDDNGMRCQHYALAKDSVSVATYDDESDADKAGKLLDSRGVCVFIGESDQ